mgnify:CR=1 FL=1
MLAGEARLRHRGSGHKHVKAGDNFRLESGVQAQRQERLGRPRKSSAIYTIPKGRLPLPRRKECRESPFAWIARPLAAGAACWLNC